MAHLVPTDHSQAIETLQMILPFYSKGQAWLIDQRGSSVPHPLQRKTETQEACEKVGRALITHIGTLQKQGDDGALRLLQEVSIKVREKVTEERAAGNGWRYRIEKRCRQHDRLCVTILKSSRLYVFTITKAQVQLRRKRSAAILCNRRGKLRRHARMSTESFSMISRLSDGKDEGGTGGGKKEGEGGDQGAGGEV